MNTKQPPSGARLAIPSVDGQRARVDYALALARFGFHVFPLYAMSDAGVCSCWAGANCDRGPGKHPRTKTGFKDAVVKPHEVERLWRGAPNANVAIATGPSGLVVIDIDPRHGGDESLAQWEQTHGPLTPTLTVRTGGGGRHLFYFRPQGLNIGIGVRALPGVDWRGDGGYVVAHGSNHKSGGVYEFVDPEMPVAMLDQHVADLLLLREVETAEKEERKRHGLDRIGKTVLIPKSVADKRVEGIIAFRERELKMLVEGERNDKLARSLISLGKLLHLTTFSVESIAVRLEPLAVALDQPPAMVVRLLRFGSQFPGQLPEDMAYGIRTPAWVRESERRLRQARLPRDVIDAADIPPPRQPPAAAVASNDGSEWTGAPEPDFDDEHYDGEGFSRDGGAGGRAPGPTDEGVDPRKTCRLPHTDLGNSTRLHMMFGEDIRWCETRQKWLTWNRVHWVWEEARFVHSAAQRMVETLLAVEHAPLEEDREELVKQAPQATGAKPTPEEAAAIAKHWAAVKVIDDLIDASYKHAKASQGTARITAMEREIKGRAGICIRETELDRNPCLLGCVNGVIDVRTRTFRPPERLDYITRCAAVKYDPRAACPNWLRMLERVLPDPEVRGLLRRAFGYSLMGDVGAQRWFLLTGAGSNGKSTILDTFRTLLGPYAATLPARVLEEQTIDQHPTELITLLGARFAVGSEPRKGKKWDAERIKGLTGDANVTARRMREDFFEFPMTAKLFVSANDLPVTNDHGHGFWRRIVVIPFEVIIPDSERDSKLMSKLLAEGSGILNWALDGAAEYLTGNGLAVPSVCEAATAKYKMQVDDVERFIDEMCVTEDKDVRALRPVLQPSPENEDKDEKQRKLEKYLERVDTYAYKCQFDEFFAAYNLWWAEEGTTRKPLNKVHLGRRLSGLGFDRIRRGKTGTRWVVGLFVVVTGDKATEADTAKSKALENAKKSDVDLSQLVAFANAKPGEETEVDELDALPSSDPDDPHGYA